MIANNKIYVPPYSLECVHHPGRMRLEVLQSLGFVHTIWHSSNLENFNKWEYFPLFQWINALKTYTLTSWEHLLGHYENKGSLPLLKSSETLNVWATGTSNFAFFAEGSSVGGSSIGDLVVIVPFSRTKG